MILKIIQWRKLVFEQVLIFKPLLVCNSILYILDINSVRSLNLRFKYQSFTSSGCKYIGIIKFKFVAKT